MAKKVFAVMGATGQIGKVIVDKLVKSGHQVKAIGRDAKKLEAIKGAETIRVESFDHDAHLMNAFKGADGVFVMIPPGYGTDDYAAFQDKVGEAIKKAVEKSGVRHVVNLSSLGAHLQEGTGPIKGLHKQEQRLKSLANVNIIHLRPAYFMENLVSTIPTIIKAGVMKNPLNPSTPFPMIATEDIGLKAVECLEHLNFKGHTVFELVGPKEKPLPLTEVAKVFGKAIGKPELKFLQQPYEEAKREWLAAGMKSKTVDQLIEMYHAFNDGKCQPTQQLTPEHHGKITIQQFAEVFAKAYKQQAEKQKVKV